MDKTDEHVSRCAACLRLIADGEGITLRDGGREFHKGCPDRYPKNYIVIRERNCAKCDAERAAKKETL